MLHRPAIWLHLFLVLSLIGLAAPLNGAAEQPMTPLPTDTVKAWIDLDQQGDLLLVEAFCQAPQDCQVEYRLVAEKIGPAGTSKTSQGGKSSLTANEAGSLSRLKLKVTDRDEYRISLKVFRDGRLIAEDSVDHPPAPLSI